MEYLEFEQPIKELEEQLQKCSLGPAAPAAAHTSDE